MLDFGKNKYILIKNVENFFVTFGSYMDALIIYTITVFQIAGLRKSKYVPVKNVENFLLYLEVLWITHDVKILLIS